MAIQSTKKPLSNLRISDLRGVARLATQGTRGVARIVEGVHQSVWSTLGVPSAARPGRTRGLTGMVYTSIHGISGLVGKSLEGGFRWLEERSENSGENFGEAAPVSPRREAWMAALNGVMGDRLEADESPFALPMTLRYQGVALSWRNLPDLPEATSKVLLLVHGLCVSDLHSHALHREHSTDHGEALASTLEATPLYLRYNSGLPIPDNGRRLAALLEDLIALWPVPVEELTIVAHSMGGLVARSAVHHARQESLLWPETLKSLVFLGTPHHGSPLEKAGNWVDLILGSTPYSAPFTMLGKLRSAGITDLRHGRIHLEEPGLEDEGQPAIPLPEKVACYTVAATLAAQRGALANRLTGDGLVPVNSALGHHDDPLRALQFEDTSTWIAYRTGHMELLTSTAVTDQLVRWLTSAPS